MDCGKRDVHYNAQNRDSEQYIAQPYRTPQRPRTCLRQRPPPAPASRPQPGSAGPRGQCQPADAGGHRERRRQCQPVDPRPYRRRPRRAVPRPGPGPGHRPLADQCGGLGRPPPREPRHPPRQRTGAARGGTLGLVAGTGRALRIGTRRRRLAGDGSGHRRSPAPGTGRRRTAHRGRRLPCLRQRPAVRLRQRWGRGGAFHPQRGEPGSSLEPAFQRRPR